MSLTTDEKRRACEGYGVTRSAVTTFHRDERGLKVVEMLLLIFVAAIILIGFLKIFFPEVLQRVKGAVMELLDMEVS